MAVIRIDDPADERLAGYRSVPEPERLRQGQVFVAEGRLVVRVLLASTRMATRSVLVTETALAALADVIEPRLPGLDVFVVPVGVLEPVTGYNIHRGCLALGERPAPASIESLLDTGSVAGRPLVVLEQVGNADNMGALFRNAAAFGAGGVVVGPNCCDPLYRKAIRVSMGHALRMPFADAGTWPGALGTLAASGYTVVALTPGRGAESIDVFAARWNRQGRLALLVGAEGEGLSLAALAAADARVRIPMAPGVDSLNVATAAAIALQRLTAV